MPTVLQIAALRPDVQAVLDQHYTVHHLPPGRGTARRAGRGGGRGDRRP